MSRIARFLELVPVRLLAQIGAAIANTAFACWLVWIVWRGGWPVSLAHLQLEILGYSLYIVLAIVVAAVLSITAMQLRAKGPGNTLIELGGDDGPGTVKVTTETKVEQQPQVLT